MTIHTNGTSATGSHSKTLALGLLGAALGFALVYLSVDLIAPRFAESPLPLPNAPAAEARDWYAANGTSAILAGVLQALSVGFLALFASLLPRTAPTADQARDLRSARAWGWIAAALMLVSSAFSWVLAATAESTSIETVDLLRTANFVAGGTAHVVALGVFVLLASRGARVGRRLRIFARGAAVPAIASLVSLVVFEGAALILLGRLLCMAWVITAAISLGRRSV